MQRSISFLFFSGTLLIAAAETNIGGNLGGMTIDSTGNPYVVDREIVIPKGKSLTIIRFPHTHCGSDCTCNGRGSEAVP